MLRLFRHHEAASMRAMAPSPEPARFCSHCLGEFLKRLKRVDPHPAVLDLGVLCGDNIAFLGARGCRVSVESHPTPGRLSSQAIPFDLGEDGLRSRAPKRAPNMPPDVPSSPMNYPPESFAGILAWDAISRMPFQEGIGFAETLRRLLLVGGVILAYFPGPPGSPKGSAGRYRILGDDRLAVEPAAGPRITGHVYQNRQIYSI
ncbi:MAG: hypothetical protein ACE5IM_14840, partial [Nitrospinota bacterium]